MMFSRIQTALAGLFICAVMCCTQLAAADGKLWADHAVAKEESGTEYSALGSGVNDPDDPVIVQPCVQLSAQRTTAAEAAPGYCEGQNATRASTIRAPPTGSDNSA